METDNYEFSLVNDGKTKFFILNTAIKEQKLLLRLHKFTLEAWQNNSTTNTLSMLPDNLIRHSFLCVQRPFEI